MREFVIYTGSDASHDLETRRKIRSQAMRDFRRRQRTENVIEHLTQGKDQVPDAEGAKESVRQRDGRVPREIEAPGVVSRSLAHGAWGFGTADRAYLPEFHLQGPHGSSTASSSASSDVHTPVDRDYHVSGPSLLDDAEGPLAAPPSIQARQSCPVCWPHNAGCSDFKPPGFLDQSKMHYSRASIYYHHHATDLGSTSTPSYSMPLLSSRDARDQTALQYFQYVAAKDVSGIVAVGFWELLVPRMCQMEDAVRQAAIALGRVHLLQTTGKSSPRQNSSKGHSGSLSSLESEMKANKALSTYIEKSASPSHEVVLTCSIMLHTLESILGRETSAMLHLENGLKMFRAWQEKRKHSGSGASETLDSLSMSFARLDLSATIANDDRMPNFEYDDGLFPTMFDTDLAPHMSFRSPLEAHHQLMRIGTPAWAFMMRNQHWRHIYARFVPIEVIEEQRMHMNRYRNWSMIMNMYESDRLCNSAAKGKVPEHDRRAETMSLIATHMHHWAAKRLLEESIRDDQDACVWDREPRKLLRYAKAITDYTEEVRVERGHQGQTSYSPEIGICGIIMCLAHRTALPHIRSEALELAQRFDCQEGARDLCAAFTGWTQLPHPRPKFTFMMGEPGH